MIRELLTTILVAALAIPAMSVPMKNDMKAGSEQQHRGVKLTPEQAKVVQAVSGTPRRHSIPNPVHGTTKRVPFHSGSTKAPQRVNSSGSRIQGWRISDQYGSLSMPNGWYELNLNGTEKLLWEYHDPDWVDDGWSDEPSFPFTSGFYHEGKVVGFHSEMLLYWLIWGYGCFTLDGEILEYHEIGDDLSVRDFSTYVISCVNNESTGETYAYTLNPDASGYMLQKVDIETWKFTPMIDNVPIENVCVGLAYNPDDTKIYGYTPDSRFVTLDGSDGNLTTISRLNLPVATNIQGMTYSPLDKAFIFVYTATDDEYATLYTVTPSGLLTYCTVMPDALQYNILVTPDKIVDANTPLTPEICDIEFERGSLDGKAIMKLPASTFGESPIAGRITLTAFVDGKRSCSVSGQPGETVDISINGVEEGTRNFSFTAAAGGFESAAVEKSLYVGYDTPVAPENITLTEGVLSWNPVTVGLNGGYIDCDAMTYNVYLNGEKINETPISGCSYIFTMPDEVYRKYIAQVEADNHGHLSDRGFSNDIKAGKAFPLPFSMSPTAAEGELITVYSQRSKWYQWNVSNNPADPYISCGTNSYDGSTDEWFVIPAVSIPESDRLLQISFDVMVQHGISDELNENISVTYSSDGKPESMQMVKTWNGIDNTEEWRTLTCWCHPEAGDTYIGFKTTTHEYGGDLTVRNIRVSMSDRVLMTPAEVSGLTAQGLPQGQLKAKVEFTMPTISAAGIQLPTEKLTATVTTSAGEISVSGMPGSEISVEVPTVQGWNEIFVKADNQNEGLESSVRTFTGADVPEPLAEIRTTHSSDYRSLHLEWDAPTEGYNGGYVNPESVEYAWYEYDYDEYEWKLIRELGTSRSLDITPEIEEGIIIKEGAILAKNSQGNCGVILRFSEPAGYPYSLPMIDNLNIPDRWGSIYEPYILERPDETYLSQWGFCQAYPYQVSKPSPYGEYAFCALGSDGIKGRISFPAFSTKDVESVSIELPLWCGPNAAEIAVYAKTYGTEPELIGIFHDTTADCWKKHRFHLPAKFIGKDWVEIKVDAVFEGDASVAAFADFRIKTFLANDLGVTDVTAPIYVEAGNEISLSAYIENMGLQTVETPQMEILVYNNGSLVTTLPMECVSGSPTIEELGTAHFETRWTPDGNSCGELRLEARIIRDDMDMSNNSLDATCDVSVGNQHIINDLSASVSDKDVTLIWTEPTLEYGKEGFENYSPFYFSDKLGDFKTITLDGMPTTYFAAFRFPHDEDAKSWQVLGESEISDLMEEAGQKNEYVSAYSGNNVLAAFVPYSIIVGEQLVSDKWLISPEVKGGSTFSFMLSSALTGYQEKVEVMYSESDASPESFKSLDNLVILSRNWNSYEYTLPENARYFAIVYRSDSSNGFFVMVDDICYEPAAAPASVMGYDIMRDGTVIGQNISAQGSWIDNYIVGDSRAVYNVMPVLSKEGVVSRGVKSNDAVASASGVDDALNDNCVVTAGEGFISIRGCEDARIDIYRADGIRIATIQNPSASETVKVGDGVYIVRTGTWAHRLIVK